MTLKELGIGKNAVILSVGGEGALRQHFLDMGLIPGAEVTMVKFAPMGDPLELKIHGYELTLRVADAEKIEIRRLRFIPEKAARISQSVIFPIRVWEKAENIMRKKRSIRCRKEKY